MSRLLDPRLRRSLATHWPSVCTILLMATTTSASNEQVRTGSGTAVTGMSKLPCRMGPFIQSRISDDLRRDPMVKEYHQRKALLVNAYIPTVVPDTMGAQVDGVIYPIRAVEVDSEHFTTRLELEVVTPNG